MEREILFRGKRVDNGEWVEGGFHKHIKRTPCPIGDSVQPEDIAYMIVQSGFSDWNMPKPIQGYVVNPETVSQYTGLTDCNGQRIFEGDFVQYKNSIEQGKGVVEFNGGRFYFKWVDIAEPNTSVYYFQCSKELEIIGNRWDNPELLGAVVTEDGEK